MKEINSKPDIRETRTGQGRNELPRERFNPNRPCDNIGLVKPEGASMWKVYEAGKPYPLDTKLPRQRFGEYKHHGKDFILFEKTNPSSGTRIYSVCDSNGKVLKNDNSGHIGKFVGSSGENMIFEKGNMQCLYNKDFMPTGQPQRIKA